MQQNYIYNIPLPTWSWSPKKKKNKDNERGINYRGGLKKTSDSPRGHKTSTRDGSVIDSYLTYKFGNMDRSSHGVFVSKNQTKVTYPPSTTRV
jgi:hypothetical protein